MHARPTLKKPRPGERSFSLIETVIALSIVTFLIIEVSAVQGNAIVFSEYGRNVTQASWLAKRVMANVEYRATYTDLKELETATRDVPFQDFPDYSYSLEIKEWKLSMSKILSMAMGGGMGGGEDEEEADDAQNGEMGFIEQGVKQVFGDDPIFVTAVVEVSWAEGAQRNSTSLTHLFANQPRLDAYLATLKPVWDQVTKPKTPPKPNANNNNNNQDPNNPNNPPPPPPPPPGGDDGGDQ